MLIGKILINILTLFCAFNTENRMAYSEIEGNIFCVTFFCDFFFQKFPISESSNLSFKAQKREKCRLKYKSKKRKRYSYWH
jgi:hypothetical protein